MAWTAPKTWATAEVLTAADMNTYVSDNMEETAPGIATSSGSIICGAGTNQIAQRIPDTVYVSTSQTTTSTSYTDLATAGPAVTVTCGSRAIVMAQAFTSNSTQGNRSFLSVAVSGSSSVAAADDWAAIYESGNANDGSSVSTTYLFEGLTAGSNTFTMKYRANGGTGAWSLRRLTVIPL